MTNYIIEARKRVGGMDQHDRAFGYTAPVDEPLAQHAQTILFALESAINTRDWTIAADAYVLMEQLTERLETPQRPAGRCQEGGTQDGNG